MGLINMLNSFIGLLSGWQIFLICFLGIVFYMIIIFNKIVVYRNRVDNSWGQIDAQLKRRFDLIPNLVETVKGASNYEKDTLENITRARSNYLSANRPEEILKADKQMSQALTNLFAVAESYPELKANSGFIKLQEELSVLEEKIVYTRQFYNDTVMRYNNSIQMFPSNIFAGLFGFEKIEYFNVDENERDVPKVKF